jgi:hypothetical protein
VAWGQEARHRKYIAQNPVKARLADTPQQYSYSYSFLAKKKGSRGVYGSQG